LLGENRKQNYGFENAVRDYFYKLSDQCDLVIQMVDEMVKNYTNKIIQKELFLSERYRLTSYLFLWAEKDNSVYTYLIHAIKGKHERAELFYSKIKEIVDTLDGIEKDQATFRDKGEAAGAVDVDALKRKKEAVREIINSFPPKGLLAECFK